MNVSETRRSSTTKTFKYVGQDEKRKVKVFGGSIPLEMVLEDRCKPPLTFESFFRFAETQLCEENLLFIARINKFKAEIPEDRKYRDEVKSIISQFIIDEAPYQVILRESWHLIYFW